MELKPINTFEQIKEVVESLGGSTKTEGLNFNLQDYTFILVSSSSLYAVPKNRPLKYYVEKFDIIKYLTKKQNVYGVPCLFMDKESLKKDIQVFLYGKRLLDIEKDFEEQF